MCNKALFYENNIVEVSEENLTHVGEIYYLDAGLSREYGPASAFVLSYFAYHYLGAIERKCNYQQGRYWVPVSLAKLEAFYPFLTRGKLRTALALLEAKQVFFVDNFNSRAGDKTKWYSLNEENPYINKYLHITRLRLAKQNKHSHGQNNQALGENNQALGQNSQAFGQNNQAISNNNIINNNINNKNTHNQPKNYPKKKFSALLPLT